MDITNNTILITGGGSGIGKGLAEMLLHKGNTVIIAGRNKKKLNATAKQNPGIHVIELDITDSVSIDALVNQVKETFPKLNGLILCAGIMQTEEIGNNDIAIAKHTIATNLTGIIELNSKLLPIIQNNKPGIIMTVSSGLAFIPLAAFPTYCATKAAIHSYTQSLRTQLREKAVQVIELEPPYVQTELTGPHQATDPAAMPLPAFIQEVTTLLENGGADLAEIQVENVKFMRQAESSGEYNVRYNNLNGLS